MRQTVRRICPLCGKEFTPKSGNGKYCSEECKREGHLIAMRRCNQRRKTKNNKAKAGSLSINEVLALGRKHNIIGYSNILLAIERGEIKV